MILPQYGYDAVLCHEEPGESIDQARGLQQIRSHLRDTKAAVRYVYFNRKRGLPAWARIGQMDPPEEKRRNTDEIPAVLFPRHFIVTPEKFQCSDDLIANEQLKEGVSLRECVMDGEPETCLILYTPSLIKALGRAYKSNYYGDEIHLVNMHLRRMATDLCHYEGKVEFSAVVLNPFELSRPWYWHLDREHPSADGNDAQRWKAVDDFDAAWREGHIPSGPRPTTADAGQGFKDALRDLDADFLLLGLSSEERTHMDGLVAKWSEEVSKIVAQHCALGTIGSVAIGALEEFCRNSRVDRKVIEVAQRYSLAGHQPLGLFLESKASLLRRWDYFLKAKRRWMQQTPAAAVILNKCGAKEVAQSDPPDEPSGAEDPGYRDVDTPDFDEFDQSDDSDEPDPTEVDEMVALIRAFIQQPRNLNLAGRFDSKANEPGSGIWIGIYYKFKDETDGKRIANALPDALKICRGKSTEFKSQDSRLERLMSYFEKLGRQA